MTENRLDSETGRLVIISNRLPITVEKKDDGGWQIKTGAGGLVSALSPILRDRGGLWIGWPGAVGEFDFENLPGMESGQARYTLKPVYLTRDEVKNYYSGFSNEILWPLFHDMQSHCNFNPAYWSAYQAVNRKFARVTAQNTSPDDYLWVHDYHLFPLARELHNIGVRQNVAFFLHIPFPSPDMFNKLPWRRELLKAILEFDLIGFQTARDRNNFLYCAESLIKELHTDARRQISTVYFQDREVKVGIFPIGVDAGGLAAEAGGRYVSDRANEIKTSIRGTQLALGVDRMDYSKGLPEKLTAFNNLFQRYPELIGKITLIQIAVPSREEIPEYQRLKAEVTSLISDINGKWGRTDWMPVHYMFRSLNLTELLAYYRAADMALVTPLKDGMNLVAKEYCAAKVDGDGVLILSEFAGAAAQLHKNALVVNPYDIEALAGAIYRAYNMGIEERRSRMQRLRNSIRKRNIFWWVDFFLNTSMPGNGRKAILEPVALSLAD